MWALRRRLVSLNRSRSTIVKLADAGLADSTWRSIAALHAAVQMTASIARCGGLRGGEETERVLEHLFEQSRKEQLLEEQVIPSDYWPVLPASAAADGEERLLLRGAVLVRVRGQRPAGSALSAE